MVSRGGRSRGCANCRRRRVKCDEKTPSCSQCTKRKLQCSGPKEYTFIVNDAVAPNSTRSDTTNQAPLIQREAPQPLILSEPLPFNAFQDDMCMAYTHRFLFRGGPMELACAKVSSGRVNPEADLGASLLRDALVGLSVAFFGNHHHQVTLQNRGHRMYGEVLRRLNMHLGLPGLQTTDYTILTALTCMLREVFLPTGPSLFLHHLLGIEAILKARGVPPAPIPRDTVVLFHSVRILSILGGLLRGTPSLFSQEEWKRIPCLQGGEGGRIRHDLFSIMADCTRFLARRNAVMESGDVEARHALVAELHIALSELETIRLRWVKANQEHGRAKASGTATDYPTSPNLATDFMIYQSAHICLLDICEPLEPSPSSTAIRNKAARELVRCLQRLQQRTRGGTFEFNTMRFIATSLAVSILGGATTPAGRPLSHVVQKALGGPFAMTDMGGTILAEPPLVNGPIAAGTNCSRDPHVNEHSCATVDIPPETLILQRIAEGSQGDDQWPLLTEYGPTTVLSEAMASMINSLVV